MLSCSDRHVVMRREFAEIGTHKPHLPLAKEPHDPWTFLMAAKHNCHPTILIHMADGLGA